MTSHNLASNVPPLQQPPTEGSYNFDPNAPFLGGTVSEQSSSSNGGLSRQPSTAARPTGRGFAGGFAAMVRRAMSNRRRQQAGAFPPPHDVHAQGPYPPDQQWPMNTAEPHAQPEYASVPQRSPPASPARHSGHSRAASQHAPSIAPSQTRSTRAPSISQLQQELDMMSPPGPHDLDPQYPVQPQAIHDVFYSPQPVQPLSPVAPSHHTGVSATRVLSPTYSQGRPRDSHVGSAGGSRHSRAASLGAPSHHSRTMATPTATTGLAPIPASPAHSHAPSQARSQRTVQSHHSRRSTGSSQATAPVGGATTEGADEDIDGTTAADHQMQPVAPPPTQESDYAYTRQAPQPLTESPPGEPQTQPVTSPPSVQSPQYHSPILAPDYLKMPSPSGSMYTINSVVDRLKQFWREVNDLPWVSGERVTVDYVPGRSRQHHHREHRGLGDRRSSWYSETGGIAAIEEGKRHSTRPPYRRQRSGEKSQKKMSIDGSSSDGRSGHTRAQTVATHGHASTGHGYEQPIQPTNAGEPIGPAGITASTIEYLRTHRPTQYAGIMYVHDNPGYRGPPPPPTPRAAATTQGAHTPAAAGSHTPAPAFQGTPGSRPQGVQLHDPPVQRPQVQVAPPQNPTASPGAISPVSALSPISTRSGQRSVPTATVTVNQGLDGLRTFPTGYVPAHKERDATAGFGERDTHHRAPPVMVGVAPSA